MRIGGVLHFHYALQDGVYEVIHAGTLAEFPICPFFRKGFE